MMRLDINADLGEGFGPWSMGDDEAMLSIVTSANIACGGHAGDAQTMARTLKAARDRGVRVGAHPGFNDREGFGRRLIPMAPDEIAQMCAAQIGALRAIAAQLDMRVDYVKPHGALGNLAARDSAVADAIVACIQKIDPKLAMLAISGTQSEQAARRAGCPLFSEVFADRGYLASGQLVPRGQQGAMIEDADEAAERLLAFIRTGLMPTLDGEPIALAAHSVCVHGDSPGAVAMASRLRERLSAHGVEIKSFLEGPSLEPR